MVSSITVFRGVTTGFDFVAVVEDLFPVGSVLREFLIVVAPGIVTRSLQDRFVCAGKSEEVTHRPIELAEFLRRNAMSRDMEDAEAHAWLAKFFGDAGEGACVVIGQPLDVDAGRLDRHGLFPVGLHRD